MLEILFAGEYSNGMNVKNGWVHQVIEPALSWIIFNSMALFAVYILDVNNPRYLYSRLGHFSGLCAVLELLVYWQAYFIIGLHWGFFFVLVPMVSVCWMRSMT